MLVLCAKRVHALVLHAMPSQQQVCRTGTQWQSLWAGRLRHCLGHSCAAAAAVRFRASKARFHLAAQGFGMLCTVPLQRQESPSMTEATMAGKAGQRPCGPAPTSLAPVDVHMQTQRSQDQCAWSPQPRPFTLSPIAGCRAAAAAGEPLHDGGYAGCEGWRGGRADASATAAAQRRRHSQRGPSQGAAQAADLPAGGVRFPALAWPRAGSATLHSQAPTLNGCVTSLQFAGAVQVEVACVAD